MGSPFEIVEHPASGGVRNLECVSYQAAPASSVVTLHAMPDDAVYIGLRGDQPISPRGGPVIVGVREGTEHRTLTKPPDARTLSDEFEWGYLGAGPGTLAEAILADRLGFIPDPRVAVRFAREVIAGLEPEFELPGTQVDDWIAGRIRARGNIDALR